MSTTPVDEVTRTVELYVRSLAPSTVHGQQEDVIERLERLDAQGAVSGFELHVWGARLDPSSAAARTETGRFLRDRIGAFTDWAERNGFSTDTFFDEKPIRSSITGEEYSAIALPTMTLAEYVDGELEFVAPCSDGDSVHTVEDRLEVLTVDERAAAGGQVAHSESD